jgi:hypothetical protein
LVTLEARILFKDYVNTVAFVSQEYNKKYLNIRPGYAERLINTCASIDAPDSAEAQAQNFSAETKRSSCNSWFDQDSDVPPRPPSRRRNISSSNTINSNKNLKEHKYANETISDPKVGKVIKLCNLI